MSSVKEVPQLASAPVTVMLVGRFAEDALEGSYLRALRALGHSVTAWDMPGALAGRSRLGRIGRFVNGFWPVEAWVTKANRDLLLAALDLRPGVLVVFGRAQVFAGALSQIKAILPQCKLVLVWPDSLLYCFSWILQTLPVYDLVATYSQATVKPFLDLGARSAAWVPLGFDPELHAPGSSTDPAIATYKDCDASFVGNYTPERESLMALLVSHGFRLRVWGPVEWERSARQRSSFRKYWQGGPLFGRDFCLAVKSAPVSLNPINPITYPAANMRLFEIAGCGGVAVSALSPEMESEFLDEQVCYYYHSEAQAPAVIRRALDDPEGRKRVAAAGQRLVLGAHTYQHRARQILDLLNLTSPCGSS